MEPTREIKATLVDLLDRVLDKGLIIHADIIISVAGIPLIGVNLKAALAGMETMLEYGMMEDWDKAQRAIAAKEIAEQIPVLRESEQIIVRTSGQHWYSQGIYKTWRSGEVYITNKRVIIFRKRPQEILCEINFERINNLKEEAGKVQLLLHDGELIKIYTTNNGEVKEAIENQMKSFIPA